MLHSQKCPEPKKSLDDNTTRNSRTVAKPAKVACTTAKHFLRRNCFLFVIKVFASVYGTRPFFDSIWHQEHTATVSSNSQPKCSCAMAGRNRLAPDPSVSVADICSALHSVTETEGCKDIQKLLHSKNQDTWKSAPDADWLGSKSVSGLFQALLLCIAMGSLLEPNSKVLY